MSKPLQGWGIVFRVTPDGEFSEIEKWSDGYRIGNQKRGMREIKGG